MTTDTATCSGTWAAVTSYRGVRDGERWGVRVEGGHGNRADETRSGQLCRVTSRAGKSKTVRLGRIVDRRSYCTIYAVALMGTVHNGVLLPADLVDAPQDVRDAYAARVRRDNRRVIDAYWALEDRAAAAGLTMDDLDDMSASGQSD